MYRYDDITTVLAEPTQLCNVACPNVILTPMEDGTSHSTGADLILADYSKISARFIRQLKTISCAVT